MSLRIICQPVMDALNITCSTIHCKIHSITQYPLLNICPFHDFPRLKFVRNMLKLFGMKFCTVKHFRFESIILFKLALFWTTWYISGTNRMSQLLIGHKCLSGLCSLMKHDTSQLQHGFSQFITFQFNLKKKWKCQIFTKRVSANTILQIYYLKITTLNKC